VQGYVREETVERSWSPESTRGEGHEGTVALKHHSNLHVQVSNGTAGTVAIESGSNTPITAAVRQSVTVVDGSSGATVVAAPSNASIGLDRAGAAQGNSRRSHASTSPLVRPR
jgi:hypothetical protein